MEKKDVRVIETFVKLQLAAEALIGFTADTANGQEISADDQNLIKALEAGNGHASIFTPQAARTFANEWTILKQQASTSTGFSATLFQFKGKDDPARGLTAGQYVLSFRSTEFIDDAVRDNQETNSMEIKEFGWAFGQISDMEKFWAGLREDVHTKGVAVTGYSLGGHLATAFTLMHPDKVSVTYTFNGAGVGDIKGATTAAQVGTGLQTVIKKFDDYRQGIGVESVFTDPVARKMYQAFRAWYSTSQTASAQEIKARVLTDIVKVKTPSCVKPPPPPRAPD